MAASASDWLHTDRTPTDVFELLGRKRLDPDTAGLFADARAAYRALLPYQNHVDRAICRRAMQLLTELGRIADMHTNPRQLDRYLELVIERLRREYLAEAGGAAIADFGRLRTWLATTGAVHPASVEAALLAILEPTDLQATLESTGWNLPAAVPMPGEHVDAAAGSPDRSGMPAPPPEANSGSGPAATAGPRTARRLGIAAVLLVPLVASAAAFPWARHWWPAEQVRQAARGERAPEAPPEPVAARPAPNAAAALPPLDVFAPVDFLPARRVFLIAVRPRRLCASPLWHDLRELFFQPISAFQEAFYNRRGVALEQVAEIIAASDGAEIVATFAFDEPTSRTTWLRQHRFASVGRRRHVEMLEAPDRVCAAVPGPTLLVLGGSRPVIEAAIDRAGRGGGPAAPSASLVHLEVDDWLPFARYADAFAAGNSQLAPIGEQALVWGRRVRRLSCWLEEADGTVHLRAEAAHGEAAVQLAPELDGWRVAIQQVLARQLRAHGVVQSTPAAERVLALTTGRVSVADRTVAYTAQPLQPAPPPAAAEPRAPAAAPKPGPAVNRPPAAEQAALALFQGQVKVIFAEGAGLPTRPVLDALKAAIDEQGLAAAAARTSALRYRGSILTVVMDPAPAFADVVERLGPPDRSQTGTLRHDASGQPAPVTWHSFGRLDFAVASGRARAVRIHSGR